MHKYSLQYSTENRDTHVHQIRKADLCSCQTNTTTKLLRKDCTISSVWSLTQEHCKFSVSQNNELIGKAQCFLDPTHCYRERRPERWRERWRQGWGMEEVREQGGGRGRGRIEREEEERGEGKLLFDEKTATTVRLSRKWILIVCCMSYSGNSPDFHSQCCHVHAVLSLWDSVPVVIKSEAVISCSWFLWWSTNRVFCPNIQWFWWNRYHDTPETL